MKTGWLAAVMLASTLLAGWAWQTEKDSSTWNEQELAILQTLRLQNLPALQDASNAVQHHPAAADLGRQLFFDQRLSRNGKVACATCHQPDKAFSDGKTVAEALARGTRNTPALPGVAYNDWFFWDGRKDSLWSQALAPLENPAEHGLTRTRIIRLLLQDPHYRQQFTQLFATPTDSEWWQHLPEDASPNGTLTQLQAWKQMDSQQRQQVDRTFAHLGKAIAAYVSSLPPPANALDNLPQTALSPEAAAGARLFIGKAQCILCHSGPLLSNQTFQNIGTGSLGQDSGRAAVLDAILTDRFNCLGEYSDASADDCGELKFLSRSRHALAGAFKVPGLRNVAQTAPYFHDGRMATLEEVVDYYVEASRQTGQRRDNELPAIELDVTEKHQLLSFLRIL
ncbi:MAG TPA: cytochrome c peroxidase [Candidatus Thiothrix moscowensis]|uniref:cytochrome-c peroxidase n=1 Tax=unclassified Thiothrix TaxID=2636184 RepID=UPI0025F62D36|nr:MULTISPECIES: cytochrome c peroxidase [unclassified Thiothrix]HRJ51233.1 cytochrome c peroxidase [Candidatus Thiothrix moscowensis]HRJ91712.1 cytochrome c peroxidase [Candidatus Thiothrix moscowensis]